METTPKEKAQELIKKFEDENLHFEKDIIESAKYYSLICVGEIINEIRQHLPKKHIVLPINWWEKVKNEINQL